jgi:FkbM family methyltransferase
MTRRRAAVWSLVLAAVVFTVAGTIFGLDREEKRVRCAVGGTVDEGCLARNDLVARYGPKLYSERDEETLIRDFFRDRRGGFFVDIGASHYKYASTTFYLEERLGWSGIAVDANKDFAVDYANHRPRTKFFAYFVSDKSAPDHPFFIPDEMNVLASGDKDYAGRFHLQVREEHVPAITLDDLLTREQVQKIDFLSLDIETGEPAALAGFDIRKHAPDLVCVEMQHDVAPRIREYFAKNDYEEIARYVPLDPLNGWFAPKRARPNR